MTLNSLFAFAAALVSATLAVVIVVRRRHSLANWCFFAGMLILAADSAVGGAQLNPLVKEPGKLVAVDLVIKSILPGFWLCFSVCYSRGNYREFLSRWKYVVIAAFVLPVALSVGFHDELLSEGTQSPSGESVTIRFGVAAKALNIILISSTVLILMNLEQTFRSTVGTMRWRVKFVVLGLGVAFAARIYTLSQAVIFSSPNPSMIAVDAVALLVGGVFIGIAYSRQAFADLDVYPSHAFLQSSVTILLAGGYLLLVGVLAQAFALLGGTENFEIRAFVVLVGLAVLSVILLSERFRQAIDQFVSVHFRRPNHDFRRVWTQLSHCFGSVINRSELCAAAVKLVSETFKAMSVTIWLVDEHKQRLVLEASSCHVQAHGGDEGMGSAISSESLKELRAFRGPFDLDKIEDSWGETLRAMSASEFQKGGHRICVPLFGGDRWIGLAILADRVNGVAYTLEELDLLKCIGDQITAALLNLRLNEELMLAKQLEAFQTMSTFFVHDLKNAAATLTLMLQNLPVHFNDPAFREDALRGIAATVGRINELIARLSVLRDKLEINPVPSDLNQIVTEALKSVAGAGGIDLESKLQPIPELLADREKIHGVVTNLLLNAVDAVGKTGRITVETSQVDGQATLVVSDDGCGMTQAFLNGSLFRPFQTTKKKGLGIGMFQSKIIVGAHGGRIQVESQPGKGTTFRVSLPIPSKRS